jgi:hypothetical protein
LASTIVITTATAFMKQQSASIVYLYSKHNERLSILIHSELHVQFDSKSLLALYTFINAKKELYSVFNRYTVSPSTTCTVRREAQDPHHSLV